MTDRAWLFLVSVFVVLLSLAAAVWLVVSGHVHSLDGLFLLLVCKLTALAFALYIWSLISTARKELEKEREKEAAPKPAPKKATAPAAQQTE